ncbi:hypothetical protein CR203_06045 [Salipaludibacillus neizhouensis]|uniref:CDP-glycerol--glycerophosphate glycerophosphotransferase n=1 Tax=Salipaludibacillus neizhouensis TaxID=885475 RepID=A0A3A9K656_9BACI|nr:surface carbohydrate biosynthesis protein [Salipaludibacillus neizhouensis]RKL68057.1 hypothetical protein CR203_06045 [Salipaludibacillus neizhouensis]
MKVDVLILIEFVNRELEVAVAIKHSLKTKGIKVKIISTLYDYSKAMLFYSPKILIVPYLYDDNNLKKFSMVKKSNTEELIIINMHQEQMVTKSNVEFVLPKGLAKNVLHISWGDTFTQHLIENSVDNNLIYQTGSPRIDFYREGMTHFSINKEKLSSEFKLNSEKKWILFAGNFPHENFTEDVITTLEKKGNKGIRKRIENALETRGILISWFEKLVENNPDIEFIYRPHPSENLTEELLKITKYYRNFHVIKKYVLRDWVINCDVINVWTSTSVVEGYFANKKVNVVRPIEIPSDFEMELFRGVNYINTYKEFEKHNIQGSLSNDLGLVEKINDHYSKVTNFSFEAISDLVIEGLKNNIKYDYKINQFYASFVDRFRLLIRFFVERIIKLVSGQSVIKLSKLFNPNSRYRRYFNILENGDDKVTKGRISDIENKFK